MDLEDVVRETFEPQVGTSFDVQGAAREALVLRLTTTGPAGSGLPGRRAPFSLLFCGPLEPLLPQGIHRLAHPALGELDIFLVPVGPRGQEMQYEAIFS